MTAIHDDALADDGFRELTEKITRETPFRCTSYKDKCVRRRIALRMRARGAESFEDYARLLDADAGEYDQLLDALTVNVTKFFRNPTAYASLRRNVVPALWKRPGAIRIWSAGSASGEEAYSLAAVFHQFASGCGELNELARISVIGSDIDRASLDAARAATYMPASFTDTAPELLDRYFPREGDLRSVLPEVRRLARFERRDILQEPAPARTFDLIACRNVVIYLDRESQERLFDELVDALKPGGFLMIGHVETLFGGARHRLTPVDMRERIYRKPEE